MPIIAVSNPKGGTGKSTTSLVLATTLARHGASVLVVDCDPNQNLLAWKDGPTKSTADVVKVPEQSNITRTLRAAAGTHQFVIADLEGTASMLVANATLTADLVLIPMQGSAMDAAQARRAIAYIEDQSAAAGKPKPYRVLFTRTSPAIAKRDEKAIRSALGEAGVPILANDLCERAAFRSMFTYRLALDELDPADVNGIDKAIENADALASEVVECLQEAS